MSIEEFINEACHLNKRLDESADRPSTRAVLNAVKGNVTNPEDVEKFMQKYDTQIKNAEAKLTGKKKSVFTKLYLVKHFTLLE